MLGSAGGDAQRQIALGRDRKQHRVGVSQRVRLGAVGTRRIQSEIVEVPRRGVHDGVAVGGKPRGRDDAAAKGQPLESGRRDGAKNGYGEERTGRDKRRRRCSKKRATDTLPLRFRIGTLQQRFQRKGQIARRLEAIVGRLRQAPLKDSVQGCRV